MTDRRYDRRTVLKSALAGLAALPAAAVVERACAQASPPKQDENLTFTFVTDGVASGAEQAKAAAGDKVVQVVGGPMLIRELLNLGLVDDLRVDVMPVFLGGGLRLFENVDPGRVRLQKRDVREVRARTSLGFRVVR